MSDFPGKGSNRRPCATTREEEDLRDRYAWQRPRPMSFDQFEAAYKELKRRGLIKRNGRVIK